jgi:hypothetical protein
VVEEAHGGVAQMGEIYFIRQKAREYFEPNTPGQLLMHRLLVITLCLTVCGDYRPTTDRR